MNKFWIVYGSKGSSISMKFDNYADASDDAKRRVLAFGESDFYILEAVAVAKQPVPQIEIVTLKS